MADTIKIKFQIQLTKNQISYFTHTTTTDPSNRRFNRFYITKELESIDGSGTAVLKCVYLPRDYKGNPLLILEFSVPRMLYGKNFPIITDINSAITKINPHFEKLPFLPKLDIGEGILMRVDFCFDHYVGDDLDYYLMMLGKLSYPHRANTVYDHHNVVYYSKHDKTTFYDKFKESCYTNTEGFLRQETSLRTRKVLKTRLDQGKIRLKDLTKGMASKVLEQDLERLKIQDCSITGFDLALQKLLEKYPGAKGRNLYNFCRMSTEHSEKSLIEMGYISKDTYYKYKRALKATGITSTLLKQQKKLSPLRIDWNKYPKTTRKD